MEGKINDLMRVFCKNGCIKIGFYAKIDIKI